jgi:hypothetical protein
LCRDHCVDIQNRLAYPSVTGDLVSTPPAT